MIVEAVNNYTALQEERDRLKDTLKEIMRFQGSLRFVMEKELQSPENFIAALDAANQLLTNK